MSPITASRVEEIPVKSILIATDFSAASERALHYAASLARRFGAHLYLVHIVASSGLASTAPAQRDAALLERKLILSGELQGVRLHVIVHEGDVGQELEKVVRSQYIDMMIVGTHSRTGVVKLVLGSAAEKIFRAAACPVLTVGPQCRLEFQLVSTSAVGSLLFPTDFSEDSFAALRYAASFAKQFKTKLVLLHLLPFLPLRDGHRWYTADDVAYMTEEARVAARERLERLIEGYSLQCEALCIAKAGQPVSESILCTAKALGVDGIVLGLHRKPHIDVASHLPWSTAYEVICGAECPVLTVRR